MKEALIAPSILSANFARLGEEVDQVLASGADWVHFDVMDNHFVPNLTIGPMVCEALRKHGVSAPIDVHLMIEPVDRIIPDFVAAGATYITFHPEASPHIDRTLQLIRSEGCKAGLVFNPATPLTYLEHVIDKLDMILLMSVNPGFGGQSFIPSSLEKLRKVRQRIDASGRDIRLEIDGGVKIDNIAAIREAGADTFVAGSAIFGAAKGRLITSSGFLFWLVQRFIRRRDSFLIWTGRWWIPRPILSVPAIEYCGRSIASRFH
ncbi:MAG: ribulose-phosphate 3-epimerase [Gammaproteobacteria bacterium]|nr:ribulose-phosphate 3-epimerase [Gammaproteobacteria bacterium]